MKTEKIRKCLETLEVIHPLDVGIALTFKDVEDAFKELEDIETSEIDK